MSTSTEQVFDLDRLGHHVEPVTAAVTREALRAYAAATNDDIPAHARGDVGSPAFAFVPAFQPLAMAAVQVIPQQLLLSMVHGEQDFRFHGPIEPGMDLTTTARPVAATPRSSGVTITAHAETRHGDRLLVEQAMTLFVRGGRIDAEVGSPNDPHGLPDGLVEDPPAASVEQTVDADQTFRYADASGDRMPIHLDEKIARDAGLDGIILHGLCTLAFATRAVLQHAGTDATGLTRLAVRFARPMRPGRSMTTRIWTDDAGALLFQTTDQNGTVVLTDGRAEPTR